MILLPKVEREGKCALEEEAAENDSVGKSGVCAERKGLCVRPVEEGDEVLWREGLHMQKTEETGSPGGSSGQGYVIIGKTERMASLYKLKPFSVGVELGASFPVSRIASRRESARPPVCASIHGMACVRGCWSIVFISAPAMLTV